MALLCETNTRAVERGILRAARAVLGRVVGSRVAAVFEHGQWWLTDYETGAQWSVVDASGGASVDGLDLEQVTPADGEWYQ